MNVIKGCRHGLMIYNQRDIWQGRSFEVYGEYSEDEVRLFARVLKAGDRVVEVGGNIGALMLPLSRIVGPNGGVTTFEPERTAFCALAGNVAVNNLRNVFCFQQAMGKEVGRIRVPEANVERSGNYGGLELDKDYSQIAHYLVALNTIDNMNLQRCDLIKIDVEGMELDVLQGAGETIDRLSPVLIVEDDRSDKSEALRTHIRSKGYTIYLHQAPFFNPNNFHGVKENVFGNVASFNLFCHKRGIEFDPIAEFGMQLIAR